MERLISLVGWVNLTGLKDEVELVSMHIDIIDNEAHLDIELVDHELIVENLQPIRQESSSEVISNHT